MRNPRDITPAPRGDGNELDTEIVRHLDGQLDADAFASLNGRLASDTDAIDLLLETAARHAMLAEQVEQRYTDRVIAQARIEAELARRHDRRRRVGFAAAIAAAVIPVVGWWAFELATPSTPTDPNPGPRVDRDRPTPDRPGADEAAPDRIDLTQEIFAGPIDGPEPLKLLADPPDESAADRPAVALATGPVRLTLASASVLAHPPADWSILGGTLESSPHQPATVSPAIDLNPSLKLTP